MKNWLTVVLAGLLLCACSSNEVLISKPATVPAGLDLSGDWVMSGSMGFSQPESRELAVSVFLEMGSSLKVTQTSAGLFFSFDRSIVEEYPFGENREVAVGAIKASRVSGWEGGAYVIETLDKEGAKLIETWQLQQEGRVLQRTMFIWSGGDKELALEQNFDRI